MEGEVHIHLVPNQSEISILNLGRSWGQKHAPELNWKDFALISKRSCITTLRVLSQHANTSTNTGIEKLSFQDTVRSLRKWNVELYKAGMAQSKNILPRAEHLESANLVGVETLYTDIWKEFSDVFRQELPDTLPRKWAFKL